MSIVSAGLDDLECSMIGALRVLQRWVRCCAEATGVADLGEVDVLVLQQLRDPAFSARLTATKAGLDAEDAYIVGYSLRKLIAMGLVCSQPHDDGTAYTIAPGIREYLAHHGDMRDRWLSDGLRMLHLDTAALQELAHFLRKISGHYDQAARAASNL